MSDAIPFAQVGRPSERLGTLEARYRIPLPPPYDKDEEPPLPELSPESA